MLSRALPLACLLLGACGDPISAPVPAIVIAVPAGFRGTVSAVSDTSRIVEYDAADTEIAASVPLIAAFSETGPAGFSSAGPWLVDRPALACRVDLIDWPEEGPPEDTAAPAPWETLSWSHVRLALNPSLGLTLRLNPDLLPPPSSAILTLAAESRDPIGMLLAGEVETAILDSAEQLRLRNSGHSMVDRILLFRLEELDRTLFLFHESGNAQAGEWSRQLIGSAPRLEALGFLSAVGR